jgi:hypothetical protein
MAFEVTQSPKRCFVAVGGQSLTPTKRRRCAPALLRSTPLATLQAKETLSPFAVPKLTSDEIIARLTAETSPNLLHRRHHGLTSSTSSALSSQQFPPASPPALETDSAATTSTVIAEVLSPPLPHPHHRDVPLLTLKQVGLVCERMLRERDEQIRQEYDRALACRLSEQYEAFLMFNHDQLQRRSGEEAASYVS